jgi:hypothetical protein
MDSGGLRASSFPDHSASGADPAVFVQVRIGGQAIATGVQV